MIGEDALCRHERFLLVSRVAGGVGVLHDRQVAVGVPWAVEPGDMVVFHANVLHGGAPTRPGRRRRTVSLRYFGDDAVFAPRQRIATDPEGKRVATTLASAFGEMRPGASSSFSRK